MRRPLSPPAHLTYEIEVLEACMLALAALVERIHGEGS